MDKIEFIKMFIDKQTKYQDFEEMIEYKDGVRLRKYEYEEYETGYGGYEKMPVVENYKQVVQEEVFFTYESMCSYLKDYNFKKKKGQ